MKRFFRSLVALACLTSWCSIEGCSSGQSPKGDSSSSASSNRSQSTQPVPAKVVNGKPQGLYYMQRYWIATRYLEKSCWYFAPDGQVYENLTTGFSPEDLAAHKGPKGTFKAGGGLLEVTWADGKTTKSELEFVSGGFNWNTGAFLPIAQPAKGKSIVGSYEGGSLFGAEGSSVIVSKSLSLESDGSYTLFGISSVTATSNGTQARTGGEGSETGRWELDGLNLRLTKTDGSTTRLIAIPFDDEETSVYPDRIFVGGTMYKKK